MIRTETHPQRETKKTRSTVNMGVGRKDKLDEREEWYIYVHVRERERERRV
jgi:hypothetical protein